jgi:SH3 domain-containing YSC84-like protein 1
MPKFSTPLPQPLPKECEKAARICGTDCWLLYIYPDALLVQSFGDSRNDGLDGVIPRSILAQAKGFAIFTVVKAAFILSARAGSGVVIAKLEDGSEYPLWLASRGSMTDRALLAWSAPSAIGTAGMGRL